MRALSLLVAVVSALGGAGGSSSVSVAVRSSDYGRILFDGRGRALYAFTRDGRGRSRCSGACAKAWPPFIVRSRPKAAPGVKSSLIGTARRGGETLQVTYGGRPLYFYVGDRRPGQVLCQNVNEFGGLWLVVRPSGKLVR